MGILKKLRGIIRKTFQPDSLRQEKRERDYSLMEQRRKRLINKNTIVVEDKYITAIPVLDNNARKVIGYKIFYNGSITADFSKGNFLRFRGVRGGISKRKNQFNSKCDNIQEAINWVFRVKTSPRSDLPTVGLKRTVLLEKIRPAKK